VQLRRASERTVLDRAIGFVSPRAELARLKGRVSRTMLGFRAANISRLRRRRDRTSGSADRHLTHAQLHVLRENARELDRDNCIAGGLLNRMVDNIVGEGGRFEALTDDEQWNTRAEGLFDEWAFDADTVDVAGRFAFWEMSRSALRAVLVDGDHLMLKIRNGTLQQVEGHQLGTPTRRSIPAGTPSGTRIIHGVEITKTNKPVAYHFGPSHRGIEHIFKTTRVEASKLFWLWNWKRCSQTRGQSSLADTDIYFEHLDRYIEFAIVASQVASAHVIGVETEYGEASGEPEGTTELDELGNEQFVEENQAGTMLYMEPGEKVKPLTPAHPMPEFEPFLRAFGRIIGLPYGLPIEVVLLDWSQGNYASARGAMQQAKKAWRNWQKYIYTHLMWPVWVWKIRQFIAEGKLANRDDHAKMLWVGPGWDWIDVYKEVVAAERGIGCGIESRARVLMQRGLDLGNLMRERAKAIVMAKAIAKEFEIENYKDVLGKVKKPAGRATKRGGTQGE